MPGKKKHVVVTVGDGHLSELGRVADQLRSRGLDVDEVMEAIGLITGSIHGGLSGLRSVPGVMRVEEQQSFQLPPPGAPVQ